jgi:hypothetical protein
MLIISFCPEVLIVSPVRNQLILAFHKENTVYIIQKTNFGSFSPPHPSPPPPPLQYSIIDFGELYFGSFFFSP